MNPATLRHKYKKFVYKSFGYSVVDRDLLVKFIFEVGKFVFEPEMTIKDIPVTRLNRLNREVLENLIFHLGLAEIPTYWKAFASPEIIIKAAYLDERQLSWWKDLLINGMGQYFFENKIDFTGTDFITLTSLANKKFPRGLNKNSSGMLIPIGGGKDSAVTLELLKDAGRTAAIMINPTEASMNIAKASGIYQKISIFRQIDQKLIRLNEKGYLNGHTPFSSIVAFYSLLASYLFGFKEIVLSNERSSDEENTRYLNVKINHQYSKTYEFENKFREYTDKYLIDTSYFSFLRPLYELQIAKIFSKMDKYLLHFRSCNVGQRANVWCGNCSKCLSTYILLKPFLASEDLLKIFGEDLLQKPSLKETLLELTDENKIKPFECVGTRGELRDALKGDLSLIDSWNEKHNVPKQYEEILRRKIQE